MLTENQLVTSIVFVISSIGFMANITVVVFTRKLPSMRNPFGRIMTSQAIAESIMCGIFALYFCPMVFFKLESFEAMSAHFGFILLITYDICIWCHLFIAINRLCAIGFPLKYENLFADFPVRVLVFASWIIPFATAVMLFKYNSCDLYYSSDFYAFIFSQNQICDLISNKIDYLKDLGIVIIIGIIDAVTIVMVLRTSKNVSLGSSQAIQRRADEINFLRQVLIQGIIFTMELLSYFHFAWLFKDRIVIFFMTTVAWNIVHTSDGLVIVLFNKEFRRLFIHPIKSIRRILFSISAITPEHSMK